MICRCGRQFEALTKHHKLCFACKKPQNKGLIHDEIKFEKYCVNFYKGYRGLTKRISLSPKNHELFVNNKI